MRRQDFEGLAQLGGEGGDRASEVAGIENQSGVGEEVVGGFPIGTGAAGGAAQKLGDGGGAAVFEAEGVVEGEASAAALGVVEVVASEFDGAEEGFDGAGSVAVEGFELGGCFVVGQQLAVVVEPGDDPTGVAQEGCAQAGLDPFGTFAQAAGVYFRFGLGKEGFGFCEDCGLRFGLEFFFESGISPESASAARSWRVCSMLTWASSSVSSAKRLALSMSWRSSGASEAGTRRLWLRPSRQT